MYNRRQNAPTPLQKINSKPVFFHHSEWRLKIGRHSSLWWCITASGTRILINVASFISRLRWTRKRYLLVVGFFAAPIRYIPRDVREFPRQEIPHINLEPKVAEVDKSLTIYTVQSDLTGLNKVIGRIYKKLQITRRIYIYQTQCAYIFDEVDKATVA